MASALGVNAAELLRRPGSTRDLVVDVDLDALGIDDPRLAPGEVHVALHLESLTDGIVVHGAVEADWQGTCRRCLRSTGGRQVSEVEELYQQELTDPDAFEIVGEQLDLVPAVREALVLDLPTAPLCRSDCAGLCPTCGADLNEGPCGCPPPEVDDRWQALDALRDLLPEDAPDPPLGPPQ